jgi:2-dehydropantoate 2-reductase
MTGFAVLGPGGVGGFLAAALTLAGEQVTVVAREATAAAISRGGIEVHSRLLGEVVARPSATVATLTDPVDVLFIATKATALPHALDRIVARPQLVVPLLNGLDHVELLRARFGRERVPAAVIRIESDRREPGRIVQTSPTARIDLAAADPDLSVRLPKLAGVLTAAGLEVRIGRSEPDVMWSKLIRLNALASTTSVADRPLGFIRSDPGWRGRLIACVEEGAAVAAAEGAGITARDTLAELEAAHASLGSSMQRDLAAGRTPELDAIQGSVLRAAARQGLDCPAIRSLAAAIAARAGLPIP